MWAIWILTAMMALAGYFTVAASIRQPPAVSILSLDLAGNMGIYRQAVIDYAMAHPGASGTVPDSSLVFPSWYERNPLWTNVVYGGTVAIYPVDVPPVGILDDMVKLAHGSVFAGTANQTSGTLHSPVGGDTGIPLPSAIPHGMPVWVAKVN